MKLKCNKKAQSGSWFARDNTANFTQWCKAFGMKDDSMFESEDLGKVTNFQWRMRYIRN